MITDYNNILEGYKFCECGCKELIPIYDKKHCRVRRFKHGHSNRGKPGLRGDKNPAWKGGERPTTQGYTEVRVPDHPFRNRRGCVLKHRLVMEKLKDRYLKPEEVVHHVKRVKEGGTNDIENLMLFENNGKHRTYELKGNKFAKKDMSNRYCLLCNEKTYIDKNGHEHWFIYKDGFICMKCNQKRKYRKNN